MPLAYSAWHLNLDFSSLDDTDRPEVIRKSYWPLVDLARNTGLPQGIEISGSTLRIVSQLDPAWISATRRLVEDGLVEILASGFSQIIGPLAPAAINAMNIARGDDVYREIFGFSPQIFYVPEQTVSRGIVNLLSDHGYSSLVLEKENFVHAGIPHDKVRGPTRLAGQTSDVTVLWNSSKLFQALQRFVSGHSEEMEYRSVLEKEIADENLATCVYGSDAEVFGFQVNRHAHEARAHERDWEKIAEAFDISKQVGFEWRLPTKVLDTVKNSPSGVQPFAIQPQIISKKQAKYNVGRWAVCGRNSYDYNSRCFELARESLQKSAHELDQNNQESLLRLWGSDYRTHITPSRWLEVASELEHRTNFRNTEHSSERNIGTSVGEQPYIRVNHEGAAYLSLARRRGLSLEEFGLQDATGGGQQVLGKCAFGALEGIENQADFYSGSLTWEPLSGVRHTDFDLEPKGEVVEISPNVFEFLGDNRKFSLRKQVTFFPEEAEVAIRWEIFWKEREAGRLRVGYVTFSPQPLDSELTFSTHNGGKEIETFDVGSNAFNMGQQVSSQVTSSSGFGATEGTVEVATNDTRTTIRIEQDSLGCLGLAELKTDNQSKVLRICFSLQEANETRQPFDNMVTEFGYRIRIARI